MAYTVKELKEEKFFKHFHGVKKAYIFEPYNILLPDNGPSIMKKVQSFEARADDIYVVTFVKAGTALMQEIVYLLNNGIDPEEACKVNRELSFPFLELAVWNIPDDFYDMFKILDVMQSPRLIKTHLNYPLIPPSAIEKKCKMIYVARNMKDVIVSYFHFSQTMNIMDFKGEITDFAELFLKDLVPYCPYMDHVKGFWERRNDSNILFVTYEDMRKDLPSVVRQTAEFLGKTLTEDEVHKIIKHCSFESMKDNTAVNKTMYKDNNVAKKEFTYLRKGIVGDWKNHFSEDLNEKVLKILEERINDPQLERIMSGPV